MSPSKIKRWNFVWRDFMGKYGPHVTVVFQDVELQKDGMPVIPVMGRLMEAIKAQTVTFYAKFSKGRWRIG